MKKIEATVLYSLRQMLDTMQWLGDKSEKKIRKKLEVGKKKVRDVSDEIVALKQEKIRQYTRYADNLITKEAYIKIKQELADRIEELQAEKKAEETKVLSQDEQREKAVEMTNLSEKYAGEEKLTREMVKAFIDCVYVYDPERIEIIFLFEDSIKELMAVIQEEQITK